MSEQREVIVSATPSPAVKRGGLLDGMRQLAYAWVGVWIVASDDLGNFYSRCVTRGERIVRGRLPVARPQVKPQAAETGVSQPIAAASGRGKPVSWINAFVVVRPSRTEVYVDSGLPIKADFDALIERVDALSREVETLADQNKKEQ